MVRDGAGWARWLNRTITHTSSTSTTTVIKVMTISSKLWNQMMFSITGEPASCSPVCHGVGCPSAARATLAAVSTTRADTQAIDRDSTSIVRLAPYDGLPAGPVALARLRALGLARSGARCRGMLARG